MHAPIILETFSITAFPNRKSIESGLLDTNEWDIYCAGQDIPELKFSNGYVARNLGLMSWEEYGKFLGSVDLALS